MDIRGLEQEYKHVTFWQQPKDWNEHVGKVVSWLRDAPWGQGELWRDTAQLVRIVGNRAVIRFMAGERIVTRTVRLGSLTVPGEK